METVSGPYRRSTAAGETACGGTVRVSAAMWAAVLAARAIASGERSSV